MNTKDDYAYDYTNNIDNTSYDNYDNNDDAYYEKSYKRRNLIIKIIIMVICIILLIWLISLLKNNKDNKTVAYDETLHMANVTKVRLAAERYFFLGNHLPSNGETKKISLQTLVDNDLLEPVVDGNKKVCSDELSKISLEKNTTYVLKIKLSCSADEKEEIYFYALNNYACYNCNGTTYMDGTNGPEKEEDPAPIEEEGYSCKEFSPWQTERISDPMLTEKVRTLVKVYKKGETTINKTYSEWSEYILNPILEEENIEVEKLEKTEARWSGNKETSNYITDSDRIRVVDARKTGGGTREYCASGYSKSGNICVSDKVYTADLTPSQYNSYYVINKPCNDSKTEYRNGTFVLIRKGCKYRLTDSIKTSSSASHTTYVYQELEEYPVTYYRYRTVTTEQIQGDSIYLDDYYDETNIPTGYEKVPGSEKTEYSYKVTVCEK